MTNVSIDSDASLGDLVESNPEFAPVFESLGIDYCCGGTQSLSAACEANDLEIEAVRERLEGALTDDANDTAPEWNSLTQLANVIVWEHHRPLRTDLPDLEALVEKVARVHGDSHPELREVEAEFRELKADILEHVDEEERIAFPIVKKLDTGAELTADERDDLLAEIESLEDDHDETAARLERLHDLTDGYEPPEDACMSYREMLRRLEELERDTHMHVHRENNVLFPKAAALLEEAYGVRPSPSG
ncbi:regulator of cell morphogenesis and NO signaling [Halobiforma haloterrestris]|uniref:Regulator of cell morphogenesis and NO signaling n=1 Tax=Natronobacterium haloterrestre TaxID=148448 RepID=A0A1I1D222_NATHA|nr:iron-sulfur cluster repair di-iron protein [Halobiforma haloterrestris]SFB68827.1 regulator of cell morphogenesis and NO signaling [Halobiforma haloterrestris]